MFCCLFFGVVDISLVFSNNNKEGQQNKNLYSAKQNIIRSLRSHSPNEEEKNNSKWTRETVLKGGIERNYLVLLYMSCLTKWFFSSIASHWIDFHRCRYVFTRFQSWMVLILQHCCGNPKTKIAKRDREKNTKTNERLKASQPAKRKSKGEANRKRIPQYGQHCNDSLLLVFNTDVSQLCLVCAVYIIAAFHFSMNAIMNKSSRNWISKIWHFIKWTAFLTLFILRIRLCTTQTYNVRKYIHLSIQWCSEHILELQYLVICRWGNRQP